MTNCSRNTCGGRQEDVYAKEHISEELVAFCVLVPLNPYQEIGTSSGHIWMSWSPWPTHFGAPIVADKGKTNRDQTDTDNMDKDNTNRDRTSRDKTDRDNNKPKICRVHLIWIPGNLLIRQVKHTKRIPSSGKFRRKLIKN